jgi:hypothetical protein
MAGKIVADTLEHSTAGSIATNYVVKGSAKAWARVDGTIATARLDSSLNVSSATDTSTGTYTLNLTNAFSAILDIATAVQSVDADGFEWALPASSSSIQYRNYTAPSFVDAVIEGVSHGDLA